MATKRYVEPICSICILEEDIVTASGVGVNYAEIWDTESSSDDTFSIG